MKTLCSKPNQDYLKDAIHRIKYIPGDIVETGVFQGGMMMIATKELLKQKIIRDIWLYDTYEGMPKPGPEDKKLDGSPMLGKHACTLGEVKGNLRSTKYPATKLHFIKGMIEETLEEENNRPHQISLLRLDTDFYSSTKAALEYLYPRLHKEGVLIIDDYNCWKGCQKAVNEYFRNKNIEITKIDKSAVEILVRTK